MPDDPLEAGIRELDQLQGDAHLVEVRTRLEQSFAAWEKERAERTGDAEGFAQKVDELAALRAEVMKIAEELLERCRFDGEFVRERDTRSFDLAARLRKAAE